MSERLGKRTVDSSLPRESRYVIFDAGDKAVKGFGLRVFPTGQKSWIFEYRPGEGGRRAAKKRITIGSATEFTPDEARKIAGSYQARAKVGQDPQADKAAARQALTVEEVATLFLSDHVGAKRKATTFRDYELLLTRVILPAICKLKAGKVTRSDIARIHLAWRNRPFQANRALAVVASMYNFAASRGYVDEGYNPAQRIEKYPEARRERFLSSDELERLGAAIREAETVGIPWEIDEAKKSKHVPKANRATVIGAHAAAALRLLIFTGARLREILDLKWSEVDLQRGLLLLPDSKSGRKTIVLNTPAFDVVANLERVGTYVIAGDSAGTKDEKPRSDLQRPWASISARADLTGVRLHDLRHTFASYGASGGMGLPIIGKLLGHSQASTTQRYAHLDADPVRTASDLIASTIAKAMRGRLVEAPDREETP